MPRRRVPRSRRYIKKLAERMDERRKENPKRKVELWAFDEHRVGLKPILRRQWAPKRQRPIALGQHRFEWLYLYGFVHPSSGAVVWFVCTTVDTDLLSVVLAAFARTVGAGRDKLVVLVLDNAGWHISDKLKLPDGILLEFLPAYTPELQPAERLWPLTNEAVANKHFPTLRDLDLALGERCSTLAAMPETIKAETNFAWWPTAAPANAPNNQPDLVSGTNLSRALKAQGRMRCCLDCLDHSLSHHAVQRFLPGQPGSRPPSTILRGSITPQLARRPRQALSDGRPLRASSMPMRCAPSCSPTPPSPTG